MYAVLPSCTVCLADAGSLPGVTLSEAGYPGYGSAEYAAYMQSMSAAGDGGWSRIWNGSSFGAA